MCSISIRIVAVGTLALIAAGILSTPVEGIIRPLPPYVGLPTPHGLTQLFFNSQVTRRDPKTSVACFAGYISESNSIGQMYSHNYTDCLKQASNARKNLDFDYLPLRININKTAESVCEAMRICNRVNGTLDLFNCHASVGSNNTIATYTISANATESAAILQERYRTIDLRHEQCLHKAERNYVQVTAENYDYLQACLDGRVKPKPLPESTTSTTTTSTTTTTTTTTTEAPQTTTTEAAVAINLEDQFKQLLNLLN